MRKQLLDAVYAHAYGHVKKHLANIEVLLEHSTGVANHTDIVHSIEEELMEIDKYDSQLDMLEKYLMDVEPDTENSNYTTTST